MYICAMVKEQLYEPYSISIEVLDDYPRRVRQNAFFELVYIIAGSGMHCINNSKLSYAKGQMFLISPIDKHCFDIETTTEFFFLRFNDIYLKTSGIPKDSVQRLELALLNANQRPGCIIKNETDKCLIKPLIEAMIREHVNRDVSWDKLIRQLVNTLIVVVGRNIEKSLPEQIEADQEERALDILQYIQANIYQPHHIKAEAISEKFGISTTYLGRYFKKHTGKTMQDYISSYKTKLIENRLLHSKLRISEIADELGFADESHLNKFFRKHKGISPSDFRKN